MFPNVTQDTFVEYDDHKNAREPHFTVPSTIGPEDGRHLFSYLGIFLTYITPRDLHVGTTLALEFIFSSESFNFNSFSYLVQYAFFSLFFFPFMLSFFRPQ